MLGGWAATGNRDQVQVKIADMLEWALVILRYISVPCWYLVIVYAVAMKPASAKGDTRGLFAGFTCKPVYRKAE